MYPNYQEYIPVYILYLITLAILLFGLKRSHKRKFFIVNLIIYIAYTLYMASIFVDGENFKYGNSLAILFYSIAFPLIHLSILTLTYLGRKLYTSLRKVK